MATVTLRFKRWGRFSSFIDRRKLRNWMAKVGSEAEKTFRDGMLGGHSGVQYPNLPNRSSSPSEFPASQSGNLLSTLRVEIDTQKVVIGTSAEYSYWLRRGSGRMARRRMSDDALLAGARKAKANSRRWARWRKR